MASIQPLNQVLGFRLAKHLLRRSTFRYTQPDIDTFSALTVDDAVNQLFVAVADPIPEPQDPQDSTPFWINNIPVTSLTGDNRKKGCVAAAWMYNAMFSCTIRHKMMFFLFNQFTASTVGGKSTEFYDYLQLLGFYATGDIKELALKVTFNNLMLKYLDNNTNSDNKPNENYAREFFELFTIGKGPQIAPGNYTNFTETDIVEAAKVLTGIRSDNTRTNIDPVTGIPTGYISINRHETSNKTFSSVFGNTTIIGATVDIDVEREMNDFVTMIFNQMATATYICERLYRFFVKDEITTEVQTDIIAPIANTLYLNNYQLEPCIKQLLKSQHFYDMDDADSTDNIIGGMIKSPLQLVTELTTLFDLPVPDPVNDALAFYKSYNHSFLMQKYFPSAGMTFFTPGTVAGYPAYYQAPNYSKYWFDSSTIIARYKLIDSFITGRNQVVGNTSLIGFTFDVVSFVENTGLLTYPQDPYLLVSDLVKYMFPEEIDTDRMSYFADDIFLDGMMAYNWTVAWVDYLSTQDDSVVRPRLEQLITLLVNAPEFQTF